MLYYQMLNNLLPSGFLGGCQTFEEFSSSVACSPILGPPSDCTWDWPLPIRSVKLLMLQLAQSCTCVKRVTLFFSLFSLQLFRFSFLELRKKRMPIQGTLPRMFSFFS